MCYNEIKVVFKSKIDYDFKQAIIIYNVTEIRKKIFLFIETVFTRRLLQKRKGNI